MVSSEEINVPMWREYANTVLEGTQCRAESRGGSERLLTVKESNINNG